MSHNADIVLGLLLEANTGLTAQQLTKISELPRTSVLRAMASLERHSLIERIPPKDHGEPNVWRAL